MHIKHGHAHRGRHSGAYRAWRSMWRRCTCPSQQSYPLYGGRGIKVCERWRTFDFFLADMGDRPEGCSIDRIDPDGDYAPENCRWASAKQQARNRRGRCHYLHHGGETLTIVEWSERTGIHHSTILRRVSVLGWDVARALTTPVQQRADRAAP